jgi:PAS domain S-box-containing protein
LAILVGLIIFFIYHQQYKNEKHLLETTEAQALDLQEDVMNSKIQSIASDLLFLTSHHELRKYINDGRAEDKMDLSKDMLELIRWKGIYDQIRYLDSAGMEFVRINYNNGDPYIVKPEELQGKGERYYFKDTIVLGISEIFISPFDLNIERGAIETPLKPMIRFGTPIIDKQGEKHGIALINYLGDDLLDSLNETAAKSRGRFMLLNSDGYWLLSQEAEKQWGFMFGNDKTLGREFPMEWERISKEDKGQFYSNNGLFTFITIQPAKKSWRTSTGSPEPYEPSEKMVNADTYYWKAVLHVPADDLNTLAYNQFRGLIVLYIVMFSILAVGSWKLSVLTAKRKQDEEILRSSYHDLEDKVRERTAEIEKKSVELRLELSERKRVEVDLVKAKEDWERTFDAITDPIMLLDNEFNITKVNRAMARKMGLTPSEAVGKICYEIIHDTKEHIPECPHAKLLADGKAHTAEIYEKRLGGYFSITDSPVHDPEGQLTGSIHYAKDITERMELEERFHKIFETATDAIFIMKGDIYIECNPKATEIFGCEKESIIGYSPSKFSPTFQNDGKSSKEKAIEMIQAALSGEVQSFEWQHIREDGTPFDVEVSLNRVKLSSGMHILAISRDITERLKAERSLEESEERYRGFVENFHGIALRGSFDFKPVFLHGAVERITGYTEADLLESGITWDSIVYKDDLDGFIKGAKTFMKSTTTSHTNEYRIFRKDGKTRWVQENLQKSFDSDGKPYAVEGAIYDITDRKQAEFELQNHRDNLQELVKKRTGELEDLNNELGLKLNDIERFNSLAVGREKKMIALKKEIKKLHTELEKYKTTKNNRSRTQGSQR